MQAQNPYGVVLQGPQMFDFILNASLDQIDKQQWTPTASANHQQALMYMRTVDRVNELYVSCM